jgi:alpha-1,2-mannosyltransferase
VLVRGSKRTRIAAVLTYLLFAIAPMWFTPWHGGPSESGFHGLVTLIANCYVIAGGLFLAYMCRLAYLTLRSGESKPTASPAPVAQGTGAPSLES